ncbi:MAG: hypothetical protein KME59_07670 [Trichormus sp. ATA11-4-KO1]|nr:hypothetical protein [Trichormus sp. ATA11-4-KO1]
MSQFFQWQAYLQSIPEFNFDILVGVTSQEESTSPAGNGRTRTIALPAGLTLT